MKRLIYADDLKLAFDFDPDTELDISVVHYGIDHAPTIDAVPVVRCRDCKWCSHFTDGHIECRLLYDLKPVPRTYMQMREDDYCSYGEKAEGGDVK